jgi:hypothetical protein
MHIQQLHPSTFSKALASSSRLILSVNDKAGVLYSRQKILQAVSDSLENLLAASFASIGSDRGY